jgi:hypothetical protein
MKSLAWALVGAEFAMHAMSAAGGVTAQTTATTQTTYAQALVDRELARHPDLAGLAMHVARPGGATSVVIASNDATQVGRKSGPTELDVAKTGTERSASANGHFQVELPLQDASSRTVGTLSIVFADPGGVASKDWVAKAEGIRNELARRISHTKNLFEPARMDTRVPLDSYAQMLLDQALEAHPEIVIMAIHATIPDTHDNVIVASNIGRIGKKADEDDMRVVDTGKPNLEVNESGDRFEAELPLEDTAGRNIGAIGIVYPYKAGGDKLALQRKAEQVRDELARRIPAPAGLFSPAVAASGHVKNWTPPAGKIYAQQLVDGIMAAHPELLSATLHGVPPGRTDTYTMFAGSFPERIGNADDPDDIDISKKGITILDPRWHRPNDAVKKSVMMLPLRDASGENVGEVVLAYKNPPDSGKTEKDFFLAATALRDGLQAKIPAYAALFEPAR